MRKDKPALVGIHLTRTFGQRIVRTTALREVSLELYPGQVALIMGPSGSGKSTLLAVLSGLLRPDSGRVVVLGEDLWRLPDGDRKRFRLNHFGFIFQGYNLFPALTALQQLEMVLRWGSGVSGKMARQQAEATLDLLGLAHKARSRPSDLSGGEQQRVAIGRALIKGPAFCFADEPTGALDWPHGQQVIGLLRKAAQERGATILIVAHDARIVPYADRVFHLEDGFLIEPVSRIEALLSNTPCIYRPV